MYKSDLEYGSEVFDDPNDVSGEYGTQGGGTAVFDDKRQKWVFKQAPGKEFPELAVGDDVPEEWGLAGPIR